MIDVTFEINGRKVRPNQVGDAIEKAVLQQVSESVAKSLAGVRCPTHGKRPKVKCVGRRADKLNFEISGCCDDLIHRATKRLS